MQKFLKNLFTAQRCRRAMFFLLFAAVMLLNSSPELRADALYLIADGDTVSVLDGTTDIPQERVIVTGAQSGDAEVTLPAGEKVTVTHGDDIEYATTRNGERVSELLRRLQISVSPLEMVLVDVTEEEVEITVASDFTYYETATEAAPHTTLTSTSYRIPKGETQVVQQGIDGIAITVVATQDTVESDSFDKDYDADAGYPVVAVANVNTNGDTVLKDKEEDHTIQVTVPAGALDEGVQSLKLEVVKSATPAGVQVASTESSQSYEVTMRDQSGNAVSTNGTLMTVEMNVGKNRTALKLYHNGEKMTNDNGTLTDAADHYVYDAATGYVTMKVSHFSPFTAVFARDYWTDHAANGYATPVDTANKVVTVASAEELALFAKEVTDDGKNYSGYTLNLANDVDLGEYLWKPINGYKRLSGIVVNGNGHTIRNMKVRGCTNSSVYGAGFIGDINGAVTVKDIAFDGADVFFVNYAKPQFAGNVGGIVLGYTYGTTLFENVSVTNSSIWGFGKIGILLGMGADPGVKVTFKDCVSKNNTIHAAYDMGGLAGMIQRGSGADNASVENCTVENITVDYYEECVDVQGKATLKENDKNGADVIKEVSGKYWVNGGYYWGGYADYYVSYGDSSYDAPVEGYSMRLANSEYCVNK